MVALVPLIATAEYTHAQADPDRALVASELTHIALSVTEASGREVTAAAKADAAQFDLEGGGHIFKVSTSKHWGVDLNAAFLKAALDKRHKPVLVVITTSPRDLKELHAARAFCRTFRLGFLHWDTKKPVAAAPADVPKTNINTATKEELMALPGIGEATAALVIDARSKQAFKSVNDLTRVRGIGDAKLDGLRDQITVK